MNQEDQQAYERQMDAIQTASDNEYWASQRLHQTHDPEWQRQQREKRRAHMRQLFGEIEPSWDYEAYNLRNLPSYELKATDPHEAYEQRYQEIIRMTPEACYELFLQLVYRARGYPPEKDEAIRCAIPGKIALYRGPVFDHPARETVYLTWLFDRGKPLEQHSYLA